ncbi:MAG: YgcG family protein [Burkholderiales bacterium]|nr:YgcG family protein [Burkholderiales bacterium]
MESAAIGHRGRQLAPTLGFKDSRRRRSGGCFGVVLGLLLTCAVLLPAWALVTVPPLTAPVTDLTGTLSTDQAQALDQQLRDFTARKGSQIAVLIVPTTQPEAIEQYSIRVTDAWKLGRKGVDDGVLLLVAKDDRAVRIEVGYGLEGAIPDAIAKRIVAETIAPDFQAGRFDAGIQAGVSQLMRLIDGEPLPPPRQVAAHDQEPPLQLALFVVFGAVVLGQALRAVLGRVLGAGVSALVAGIGGWLLIGSGLLAGGAALLAFFAVISGMRFGGPGGFGAGGFGAGGGGGFGSGHGGGFSGGGGGFGGGGASGRW